MPPPVPPPHHRSGGLSDESEGLHIASYASRPRLPQGQAFQPFSPGPALVAGGTAFTLGLGPVTFSLCWRREEGVQAYAAGALVKFSAYLHSPRPSLGSSFPLA